MARSKQEQLLLEKEYRKNLSRIKQFLRRAEKRGFRFESNVIPELKTKKIGVRAVQELQKITPKFLYEKATAISEETGKIVSGTERAREERRERAKKSVETRRKRIQELSTVPTEFEQEIRARDERIRQQMKEDEELRKAFNQNRMVYDDIIRKIEDIGQENEKAERYLKSVLASEIKQYGFDKTMSAIGETEPDIFYKAEKVIKYKATNDIYARLISQLTQIITGTIPTDEDLRTIGELIEQGTAEDTELIIDRRTGEVYYNE